MERTRRDRSYVDAILAEHDARKSDDGQVGACCVFAEELRAIRAEHERLAERTDELVSVLEYVIATDGSLDSAGTRSDLYKRACGVRELLPLNPKQARA